MFLERRVRTVEIKPLYDKPSADENMEYSELVTPATVCVSSTFGLRPRAYCASSARW